MGVSIYWRPIATERHNITPGARSAFWQALKDTFGGFPIQLDEIHLPTLRAMAAAATDQQSKESYEALATAIENHDEIEVYDSW
jgi:hypothetical protein